MAIVRDFVPPIAVRFAKRLVRTGRPGSEQGAEYYDKQIGDHFRVSPQDSPYYFLWTVIADRVAARGHTSLLDLGCGTGQLDALLLDFDVERLTGVDFSASRIKLAATTNPAVEYVLGDAFEIDLRAFDYTAVVCTEFLEHVADDLGVIRRLRKGTNLLASVPSFTSKGHVRFFSSVEEVHQRYEVVLDRLEVRPFVAPGGARTFYLLDGDVS